MIKPKTAPSPIPNKNQNGGLRLPKKAATNVTTMMSISTRVRRLVHKTPIRRSKSMQLPAGRRCRNG